MQTYDLPAALLERFDSSAALSAFITEVWPLFRQRGQATPATNDPLTALILQSFTRGQFYSFLNIGVWPAFKARDRERRIADAATYNAAKRAAAGKAAAGSAHSKFRAFDGPLTEKQVERNASNGVPMIEITTGRQVIFVKNGPLGTGYYYDDGTRRPI